MNVTGTASVWPYSWYMVSPNTWCPASAVRALIGAPDTMTTFRWGRSWRWPPVRATTSATMVGTAKKYDTRSSRKVCTNAAASNRRARMLIPPASQMGRNM